ncbi:MAG TPA: hypothetical protein VH369_03830 [Bryobacteraceae bacterium]|jgi:hypothetical protein
MKLPIRALVFFALAAALSGQVVAPTPNSVGPTRGDDWKNYNIVNSFETGYRFLSQSGNQNKYRSDVNFGSGVRLLSSFVGLNSKDGHGGLFDEFVFSTQGLGGDPYESASLRVQKNRLYEYNLLWRKNDYFNPGLVTNGGQGQHLQDTSTTLQDNNFTLFPQSRVKFFLGYSRSTQDGAGMSTLPTSATDFVPVLTNVKQVQNEYRLGGEFRFWGMTLNVLRGWQDFKDDSSGQVNHGTSPYWQVTLFRNSQWIDVNGRFTYTAGRRAFITNQNAVGTQQQVFTFGDARRPVATGNATVSVFPTTKLSITNHTSFYNIRTEGDSTYVQLDNTTGRSDFLYYQFLGIRTFANDTDFDYKIKSWFDVNGGYEYSNRRIAATSQFLQSSPLYSQTNELHAGKVGFRARPFSRFTVTVNAEFGRASRPFTPKSDSNYNLLTGRLDYRWKTLQLSAWSQANYNDNSVLLSDYNSHSRTYAGSGSWSPVKWFGLDASYSKLHLETLGGINFFANNVLFANQISYYLSNLHVGTLSTRFSVRRFDFYVGYNRVQDAGDGRDTPTQVVAGPDLPAFRAAQTFPLTFQSPQARVSVRISERLRWNAGYQYFGYHEDFSSSQNYLAHTGYTSLLWSF